MNRVFISYSGEQLRRAALVLALREHGLNPWRDVESLNVGSGTTENIEAELATCSGAILWIDESMLASEYVATVELPAIAKARRVHGLRVVPVFDGMSPTEAANRISSFGIDVGDSNGQVVDPTLDDHATAAEIARRYVRAHVEDARDRGAIPVVRLVSYDDTADLRDEAVLNLDWRHHLAGNSLAGFARERLRAALRAATGAVKDAYGPCEVTLAVKAHLPLALAIGNALAEPTGCTLHMLWKGSPWTVSRAVVDVPPLRDGQGMKGPVEARAASLEVSVSRDVEPSVNAFVGSGNRYRHRLMLAPPSGPGRDAVAGPDALNAWARQIGGSITTLRDRGDVDRVDIFLATPVELAIAIGWWTNAAGPVELMNWASNSASYDRMWTLP